MPDTHEERLRSAFKNAAADGHRAATPAPPTVVRARGDRKRRQRLATVAAVACVLIGGTTASLVTLLPGDGGAVPPATSPGPATTGPNGLPSSTATSDYPVRTYPPTGTVHMTTAR
ncbi:hypothetical protein ACIOC1_15005 [Streptomyces sp. NPDC088197]|uniref:hypothetical protein n=1 Tax=unclassified Streptomyces TaxID=2593676 RepID=UPI003815BBDD